MLSFDHENHKRLELFFLHKDNKINVSEGTDGSYRNIGSYIRYIRQMTCLFRAPDYPLWEDANRAGTIEFNQWTLKWGIRNYRRRGATTISEISGFQGSCSNHFVIDAMSA